MKSNSKKMKLSVKSSGKIKMSKPAYYGSSCYGTRSFNADYCSDCKRCYIEDVFRGR